MVRLDQTPRIYLWENLVKSEAPYFTRMPHISEQERLTGEHRITTSEDSAPVQIS